MFPSSSYSHRIKPVSVATARFTNNKNKQTNKLVFSVYLTGDLFVLPFVADISVNTEISLFEDINLKERLTPLTRAERRRSCLLQL